MTYLLACVASVMSAVCRGDSLAVDSVAMAALVMLKPRIDEVGVTLPLPPSGLPMQFSRHEVISMQQRLKGTVACLWFKRF